MLAGSASFANTKSEIKIVKPEKVTESCSASTGGVTFTVSCGCSAATCRKVLIKLLASI